MDPVLIDCYTQMLRTYHCSVDDILEDPTHRTEFLALVRASNIDVPERDILHGLTNLRKKSKLPKLKDCLTATTQITH